MNANLCVEMILNELAEEFAAHTESTPIAIIGPVFGSLDVKVRRAVESIDKQKIKERASVILDTGGGIVEIVERMVNVLRFHFKELHFFIPDQAMSAGTIFAMSGDAIWMDYYSCLGPIDPQIEREGKLVPALSYVTQFEILVQKSIRKQLSPAELLLLQKLDLADLHFYEQARDLSIDLLKNWLSKYKFKDWNTTESKKETVTLDLKQKRAEEIAKALSDHTRWKSHSRPLSLKVLTEQLNLKINNFGETPELSKSLRLYFETLLDYSSKSGRDQIVHTPGFCT